MFKLVFQSGVDFSRAGPTDSGNMFAHPFIPKLVVSPGLVRPVEFPANTFPPVSGRTYVKVVIRKSADHLC